MAKAQTAGNSLSDFSFDDNTEFFGIKPEKGEGDIIKEVKSTGTANGEGKKEETTIIREVQSEDDDVILKDEDFTFGVEPEKPKVKPKVVAKKEEEEVTTTDDDDVVVEVKPEPEKKKKAYTNKETVVEEAETTTTDDDLEPEDDAKFYTTLAEELKENGVLQLVEIPKDKVLTEKEFFELQNQELDLRTEEAIEGLIEGLDDDAKRFLKFKKDGGKTHEFFATYATALDMQELDDTDPTQVDKVIRHYLTTVEGLEGDEFDDRLKYIKDGGTSKKWANKWFEKIKDEQEEQKEALEKAAKAQKEVALNNAKAFNEEFAELAAKTETVGAFTFTKAETKRLVDTITKKTVKVGKDRYVPEFNSKLGKVLSGKTEADKKNLLVLAKLIDNNFKIDDIATKTTTKVVKEVKSKLREAKETGATKLHTSARGEKKELSDYF